MGMTRSIGPWRAISNDNGAIVVNPAGHCVAIVSCLAGMNEPARGLAAQIADAKLIASAPHMRSCLLRVQEISAMIRHADGVPAWISNEIHALERLAESALVKAD